ncbi:MAG: NAD-dependent epimerase/dehydratase family protein [Aestuariibacter sp.]
MATLVVGFDEFVGAAVTDLLLNRGEQVLGSSLESDDMALQLVRKNRLLAHNNAHHLEDLGMFNLLQFSTSHFQIPVQKVLFLPNFAFIHNNKAQLLADTLTVIALCKQLKPAHLVVASHHSIYYPHGHSSMSCQESLNHPINLEAATCRSMELLLHGLSASSDIPCSIVRLFDAYGQDADSNNIINKLYSHLTDETEDESLELNNDIRDFVYIDDAAQGICRILDHTALPSPDWQSDTERADISEHRFVIYNLGTGDGTAISGVLQALRKQLKHSRSAGITINNQSKKIVADIDKLRHQIGFVPSTRLEEGIAALAAQLNVTENV